MPVILSVLAVMLLLGVTPLTPVSEAFLSTGTVWGTMLGALEPIGFVVVFHWIVWVCMEQWGEE